MPIYEFECRKCHHRFETLLIRSDEQASCPHCESQALEKLISAHAVGTSGADIAPCGAPPCGAGACGGCCG